MIFKDLLRLRKDGLNLLRLKRDLKIYRKHLLEFSNDPERISEDFQMLRKVSYEFQRVGEDLWRSFKTKKGSLKIIKYLERISNDVQNTQKVFLKFFWVSRGIPKDLQIFKKNLYKSSNYSERIFEDILRLRKDF